jgi:hypothetical protein
MSDKVLTSELYNALQKSLKNISADVRDTVEKIYLTDKKVLSDIEKADKIVKALNQAVTEINEATNVVHREFHGDGAQ